MLFVARDCPQVLINNQEGSVSPNSVSATRHAIFYDRGSSRKYEDNWLRAGAERIGLQLAEKYGYTGELRREIESGETLECRPVIMGILKDIEAGDVQAIVCQDFTRLSRDEDGIDGRVIRRVCRDNDCRVITPQYEGGFS